MGGDLVEDDRVFPSSSCKLCPVFEVLCLEWWESNIAIHIYGGGGASSIPLLIGGSDVRLVHALWCRSSDSPRNISPQRLGWIESKVFVVFVYDLKPELWGPRRSYCCLAMSLSTTFKAKKVKKFTSVLFHLRQEMKATNPASIQVKNQASWGFFSSPFLLSMICSL